jgi:hypothetical protein
MKLLIILFMGLIPFFSGKPVENAEITLDRGTGRKVVAFQQTGSQGKVAFKHLDAGNYRLMITFPQQEGKWVKERPRHSTLTKATYNPANKTYYYQAEEGFFAIKISGLKKVEKESFKPLFRENRTREEEEDESIQIIVSQFLAKNRGATISVAVKAITAAQFKRVTLKTGGDISTISIPGAR